MNCLRRHNSLRRRGFRTVEVLFLQLTLKSTGPLVPSCCPCGFGYHLTSAKPPDIKAAAPGSEQQMLCFEFCRFFFFFLPDEMNVYSVQTNFTGNLQLQAYLVGKSSSGMDSSERKYH